MKAKIITTILVILVLMALAFILQNGAKRKSMVLDKVIINALETGNDLQVHIAQEKGFFRDVGLDVELKTFEVGRVGGQDLINGNSNFATMSDFSYIALLANNSQDPNLKVVASIVKTKLLELLARTDRDISKPEDLVGKKVGVTEFTAGHFFLGTFLAENGLRLADVNLVFLSPSKLVDAIISGELDAVLTWEPNVYNIKQGLRGKVTGWLVEKKQPTNILLVSRWDWLKDNSDLAEKFLQALLAAEEYIASHNEEAKSFLNQRGGYDEDYFKTLWPNFDFSLGLSQNLLLLFEDQNRWNIRNNIGDGSTLNYLDYIYIDGLLKVKPDSVTIIR